MRIEQVKVEVASFYKGKQKNADSWIEWGYPNHVLVVAENAKRIAVEQKANEEFCVAGALLHDIADAVMSRFSKNHESESLRIADEILERCGYSDQERDVIVNEVIAPHSCSHTLPKTLEGKVLATADAMAHFQTDFFVYFAWQHLGGKDYDSFKKWVLIKIEKYFNKKIFFDEYRKEVSSAYEAIKLLLSNYYAYARV